MRGSIINHFPTVRVFRAHQRLKTDVDYEQNNHTSPFRLSFSLKLILFETVIFKLAVENEMIVHDNARSDR